MCAVVRYWKGKTVACVQPLYLRSENWGIGDFGDLKPDAVDVATRGAFYRPEPDPRALSGERRAPVLTALVSSLAERDMGISVTSTPSKISA